MATYIELASSDDWHGFRVHARSLLGEGVEPASITWRWPACFRDGAGRSSSLFDCPTASAPAALASPREASSLRIGRAAMASCEAAVMHGDEARFELVYRWLWRCQRGQAHPKDVLDEDWRRIHTMAVAVQREIHKMHAFTRFRPLQRGDGMPDLHAAWFEPEHHITRAAAPFFVRRFPNMHWAILTPEVGVHWDTQRLTESSGDEPFAGCGPDDGEQLWLAYYQSTFNPARLKVSAMLREMPQRYWKNLPEAALIPELIGTAQPGPRR